MLKTMGTGTRATFNAYISDCLTQENNNNNNNYSASKSRKRAFEAGSSQSRAPMAGRQQYRRPALGARFCPPQKRNTGHPTQQKPYKVAVAPARPKGESSCSTCCQHHDQGAMLQLPQWDTLLKNVPTPKTADDLPSPCAPHLDRGDPGRRTSNSWYVPCQPTSCSCFV